MRRTIMPDPMIYMFSLRINLMAMSSKFVAPKEVVELHAVAN